MESEFLYRQLDFSPQPGGANEILEFINSCLVLWLTFTRISENWLFLKKYTNLWLGSCLSFG